MKKMISLAVLALALSVAAPANAQDGTIKEVGKDIKKGAQKAGNKTAEIASKGKSRVTDSEHKDKVGPNGENIFIDNHSRYYWVDDKGKRHYVTEAQLKDKPKED
jgi:predicted small secreted protein